MTAGTDREETPKQAARRLAAKQIRDGFEPTAMYEYRTAAGDIWCHRIRLDNADGKKWIRPMYRNGSDLCLGEPAAGAAGKPIYRLPELLSTKGSVYIVEGEKCADALTEIGIGATTSGAADSAGRADWSPLRGRECVIWPDNDEAGRGYAAAVIDRLRAVGCASARIIDVGKLELPIKGDVVDWLADQPGANADDVSALPTLDVDESNGGSGNGGIFRILSVEELLERPPPSWLVRKLLPCEGLAVIYGQSASGKTFAMIDLACAVAQGRDWFGLRTQRRTVVYVATEGNLSGRIAAYLTHNNLQAGDLGNLKILPHSIDLLDEDGDVIELINAVKSIAVGEPIGMVIIDTLNRAMPGGNENSSEDMGLIVQAAQRIQSAFACVVVYVHHSGKNESSGSRGHSSLKASADAELHVKREGDVRTITAEKVRDGEDGAVVAAFKLASIAIGPDPDDPNDALSSCVLEPTDKPRKSATLTKSENKALGFIHEAFTARIGTKHAPHLRAPSGARTVEGQTALPVDAFKAFVEEKGGLSNSDRADTQRKAYNRAMSGLKAKDRIRETDGYIWLLVDTGTGRDKSGQCPKVSQRHTSPGHGTDDR